MNTTDNIVDSTIAERGLVYGDPFESHSNIGLAWTGLLRNHGYTLDHPLPASLVAQMLVMFKMIRSARVYKNDNYIDAHAYTKFADEFQQREQTPVVRDKLLPCIGDILIYMPDGLAYYYDKYSNESGHYYHYLTNKETKTQLLVKNFDKCRPFYKQTSSIYEASPNL